MSIIKVKLYSGTQKHHENLENSLSGNTPAEFHRAINGFMIQDDVPLTRIKPFLRFNICNCGP